MELNIASFTEGDVLYEKKPFKYTVTDKSSTVSRSNDFVETITGFFNLMDCMHLIARTKSKLNDKYGIGLTADELYKKAIAINPDKQINLVSYNAGIQNLFYNDEQCQLLLLRSAYYGHPDAIVELFPLVDDTF